MSKTVGICAGGTGGHINAALSLGSYFASQGFAPSYFTGKRYLDYQLFDKINEKVTHLDAKPLRASNPVDQLKNIILNIFVFLTVAAKFVADRPVAAIGAGGYVCGPTLLAAKVLGIKVYIIEQNAIAGVTNKLLAKIANKIFLNFQETKGIQSGPNTVVVGNPVRSNIHFKEPDTSAPLKILVFGGSLGAKQINDVIKTMVRKTWDSPVWIIHQVGKGNLEEYELGSGVQYEQKEYLNNMDELYAWSNIIIGRSGASTISELRIVKRPSILIPFPFATDNHQFYNAKQLQSEALFYVNVVDQNLPQEKLENEVEMALRHIVDNKLYYPLKKTEVENSCHLIYREVAKDVRNK